MVAGAKFGEVGAVGVGYAAMIDNVGRWCLPSGKDGANQLSDKCKF
jgi:hypothetical protein